MRRNPLLLGERTKRVINRDAIVISHVIIGSIVFLDTFLDGQASFSSKVSIFLLLMLLAILGVVRYFNIFKINYHPALHLTLYHLLIGAGLVFFAPLGSMYTFVWLIILFLTNFFYGIRKTLLSLLVLLIILELQLLRISFSSGITKAGVIVSLAQFGVIVAISMFFVDTQAVSDQDRHLLLSTIDKAQLERQRLVSLINNMSDGVVATDDHGFIKLYNAAALNTLDTNVDLLGRDIQAYMHLVDKDKKDVNVVTLANENNVNLQSTDYMLKYGDDEMINVYLNISPIKLGFRHDAERGFIISFRDITREKSLEEERDEFISVISHELRTPVAVTEANISNVQFIMEHGKDETIIKTALDAAYKQVVFLANMLNDLSTLSRAERGKLDLVPELISPKEIAQDLYNDYHAEVESKGLQFSVKVADDVPKVITSNKLYMREVLQNFITNSAKYTREGSVTIAVENAANGVMFRVSDTGIGISKSDQKRIFDKFFRSEDFRTRESNGTGLGLYITRKLAHLLGAEISVESQLNKGSVFSIFIPDLKDRYPGAGQTGAARPNTPTTGTPLVPGAPTPSPVATSVGAPSLTIADLAEVPPPVVPES